MYRTTYVAALAVMILITLGGCSGFPENSHWTEAKAVDYGWLKPRAQAITPTYCYRTIGTPVCYGWPLDEGGTRLVGFAGPSPH